MSTSKQQMEDISGMQVEMEPVEPLEESTLVGEDDVFDLVEELQGSTLMRTRNRYKSSTSMFLLHLYRRSHPALNPVFAQKMNEILESREHTNGPPMLLCSTHFFRDIVMLNHWNR